MNSSNVMSSTISPGVPLGISRASPMLRGSNSAGSKAFPKWRLVFLLSEL